MEKTYYVITALNKDNEAKPIINIPTFTLQKNTLLQRLITKNKLQKYELILNIQFADTTLTYEAFLNQYTKNDWLFTSEKDAFDTMSANIIELIQLLEKANIDKKYLTIHDFKVMVLTYAMYEKVV